MRQQYRPATASGRAEKSIWQTLPWSKVTLSFFMISTFLIFAADMPDGGETITTLTRHMGEIIVGTTLFSLAALLLVFAGKLLPKNI